MLKKAEDMKKVDDEQLGKNNAKNSLESYLFSLKNSLSDKTLDGKLSPDDKTHILTLVDDSLKWLSSNPSSSKEDYEQKQKEVQDSVLPLLQKSSQSAQSTQQSPKFNDLDVD